MKTYIQWMSEIRTSGFRRFRKSSGAQNVRISVVWSEIRTKTSDYRPFMSGFQTKHLITGRYVRYSDVCDFRRVQKPDTIVSGLPNRTSGIRTSTVCIFALLISLCMGRPPLPLPCYGPEDYLKRMMFLLVGLP